MQIQWYPGHMAKAKKTIKEDLKLIDLVIEITDARAPMSGRNPDIDELAAGKSRMIILNKTDLADEEETKAWRKYFENKGIKPVCLDARKNNFKKSLIAGVLDACSEKIERNKRRGIMNKPIRAMVAGIPNVGKSTFINSIAGKAAAKTGNKPGVTKGNQWIKVDKQLELLDTPGILWPKFDDQAIGMRLAIVGSISDEILNVQEMAFELLKYVRSDYNELYKNRYNIEDTDDIAEVMRRIAFARGCLKKGNEADYEKVSKAIIEDFRSGKLGRITLEHACDY